ncbi:class I SAM-dependent methyltransferase [Mesorhizobium sp. IMUNJ 23033]
MGGQLALVQLIGGCFSAWFLVVSGDHGLRPSVALTQTEENMELPTLREIFDAHDGLGSDKWTTYFAAYDSHFARYRQQPITLLEIGVQNGGSLEIWGKYFRSATRILGCDIAEKCRELAFQDNRIAVFIGDANSAETRKAILADTATFDIIVDDGSHIVSDVIESFALYFPSIKPGGAYVVEDLHTSYWEGFGGRSDLELSSMGFFKLLADVVNKEFWRNGRTDFNLLKNYAERYNVALSDIDLDIDEVAFANSICIIRKGVGREENRRHIAGHIFKVNDGAAELPSGSPELVASMRIGDRLKAATEKQEQFVNVTASALDNVREIERLRSEVSDGQLETEKLHASLKSSEAELKSASEALKSSNAELKSASEALQKAQGEIAALRNSTSWKVTAPIRRALTAIRRLSM